MHSGGLVDDLQQVVEVGSGLDQQSLLAPAVRPGRGDEFLRVHRLGGDDRGVEERIGDLVVGLAVLHDRPVLDHDMPQRLRLAVGKRKAPRVRVGLIDLHVVDIALLRTLGKFALCGGVGRQAEAERVVCLRVRLARRFAARDGRECDRVAQLRHQRPAGVLVCVKDGDPADAVPVRIGRQRVGQRDGTSVAQIGQTALVVGVLVDDEGKIDVGQIVQIRIPALLLRRDHDFRAVLAEGVQAVGIHEFLDLPVLIQRPVDGRRSRIAAGERRGHGQPVVVGDHIVQKAERERQHQRRRLEAYPGSNSRPPYACAPPARRSAPTSRSSGGRGRASRR